MLPNWQKLSSELQNWVVSQYNLGIAKIDEAHATNLAQAQAIPVNKVAATTTGTADGNQNPFVEPETVTPFMRAPSHPAEAKSKPAPRQPIKKSADPKKTTPPTARK